MTETDIKYMSWDELKLLMKELGDKQFRADQFYEWLKKNLVN